MYMYMKKYERLTDFLVFLHVIRLDAQKHGDRFTRGPSLIFPHERTPRCNTEDRFIDDDFSTDFPA